MGDLAAMAATLPGVQLVPGQDGGANGYSVMGMGADQNNTTLNGMNFGGSGLPAMPRSEARSPRRRMTYHVVDSAADSSASVHAVAPTSARAA